MISSSTSADFGENFWEGEGYKSVVRRTEEGMGMCEMITKVMHERAEIEHKYAEKLNLWSKRWIELIDKSTEYGSNKEMIKGCLLEGEKIADLHIIIKDAILNLVVAKLRDWKMANYKKTLIGPAKPASNFADDFKKAQKNWYKYLEKFEKTKRDFETAVKNATTALKQEETIRVNSNTTTEAMLKKLREKFVKSNRECDIAREKYKQASEELHIQHPRYVEDMKLVFEKSQEFEIKRLEYFKDVFSKLQEALLMRKGDKAIEANMIFTEHLRKSNPEADVKWWAENYGVGMKMPSIPQFEDMIVDTPVDPEPHLNGDAHAAPVAATNLYKVTPETVYSESNNKVNRVNADYSNANESVYSTIDDGTAPKNRASVYLNHPSTKAIKVQALYDYKGEEGDELTFKAGETFTKLKDCNADGWCTGQKDGKIGLYPDSYAKAI